MKKKTYILYSFVPIIFFIIMMIMGGIESALCSLGLTPLINIVSTIVFEPIYLIILNYRYLKINAKNIIIQYFIMTVITCISWFVSLFSLRFKGDNLLVCTINDSIGLAIIKLNIKIALISILVLWIIAVIFKFKKTK